MPKNFAYVFAAYGIWAATFTVYLLYLRHKAGVARRALQRMGGGARSDGS
ncbi:MAG TPA: hypothetical protein VKB51_10275 [bacterium]|nr:hypothetical protein [bacterium]